MGPASNSSAASRIVTPQIFSWLAMAQSSEEGPRSPLMPGERNFPAEIFFHQCQGEIDTRGDPARGVDIPVASEKQAGIDVNRGICRREGLRKQPMRRHAPLMQEACGRQNECAGAN